MYFFSGFQDDRKAAVLYRRSNGGNKSIAQRLEGSDLTDLRVAFARARCPGHSVNSCRLEGITLELFHCRHDTVFIISVFPGVGAISLSFIFGDVIGRASLISIGAEEYVSAVDTDARCPSDCSYTTA